MSDLLNRFAPDFTLPPLTGGRFSLSEQRGNIVVLTFWSAECPWSRRADVLLVYRMPIWSAKGVRIVGVASNAGESENEILLEAENRGVKYPVVLDPEHRVADLYRAETTPQFFILDRKGVVRYAGALDDATFKRPRPKVIYVDRAVTAMLENHLPEPPATLPFGSSLVRYAAPTDDRAKSVQPSTQPPQ